MKNARGYSVRGDSSLLVIQEITLIEKEKHEMKRVLLYAVVIGLLSLVMELPAPECGPPPYPACPSELSAV
jgi:hypothetical protein